MSLIPTCPHCDVIGPSRRAVITGLAAVAVSPAAVLPAAAASDAEDERFMRMAIAEARRADFPFGAVIVRDGKLLASGRNLGRTTDDPTAHGEMVAIRNCLARHGSKSLRGATIYVGRSPARCAWARSCGVISAGWCLPPRSSQLASKIDQIMRSRAPSSPPRPPFAPISITGGVLADEAMRLFAK